MMIKPVIASIAMVAATALLVSCSGGGIEPNEVNGVPEQWVTATKDGWPDSAGFGSSMPMLSRDKCELLKDLPEILGSTPKFTDTGWGPLGSDSKNENSYRYTCGFWSSGNYAGSLDLLHPDQEAAAESIVRDFQNQPDIAEQENTVTSETVGDLEIHVVERWYPTNPQGRYLALYHDKDTGALVQLEINSLDKTDFEAFSAQQAADTLIELIARGS